MATFIDLFEYPLSAILAAAFVLSVIFLHTYLRHLRWVRLLSSRTTGIVLLACIAVGLMVEGTWPVSIHSSACFALLMLLLLTSLSLAILRGLTQHAGLTFLLSHAGMFLILFASYFGKPDVVRGKMIVSGSESVQVAYDGQGRVLPMLSSCLCKISI